MSNLLNNLKPRNLSLLFDFRDILNCKWTAINVFVSVSAFSVCILHVQKIKDFPNVLQPAGNNVHSQNQDFSRVKKTPWILFTRQTRFNWLPQPESTHWAQRTCNQCLHRWFTTLNPFENTLLLQIHESCFSFQKVRGSRECVIQSDKKSLRTSYNGQTAAFGGWCGTPWTQQSKCDQCEWCIKKNPWPVLKCHVNIFQLTVKSIDWLEGKNVFFVDKTSL